MFHTGDRVLVCTSYGELLAVVLGVVDAGNYRVRPLHAAFMDYRNGIYARDAELRYPMDAAANEPMKRPGRLTTKPPGGSPNQELSASNGVGVWYSGPQCR